MTSRLIAAVCAGVFALSPTLADDIKREGSKAYRVQADRLEGKPLPAGALDALTDWRAGARPADLAGKPMLIVTWSSWYKTSHAGLAMAQDMHEQFGGQGLVVIGVHHPKAWDAAEAIAEKKNVTFPYAWDERGRFRDLLKTNGDPDFYVVDRAGNLRFADITTRVVDDAVGLVVAESAEEAANAGKAKPAPAAGNGGGAVGVAPGAALDVKFTRPPESAYLAAKWPAFTPAKTLSAGDFQGKKLPASLGKEKYLGDKPSTEGRIVVLDFWATWCGPCKVAMPRLDAMQESLKSDVVVIGISAESEAKVKGFLARSPHKYAQAVDPRRTVGNALGVRGIPHIVVLSTDGTIRWQGNPLTNGGRDLRNAVDTCIRVDPGVAARRAAEEEYLRNISG